MPDSDYCCLCHTLVVNSSLVLEEEGDDTSCRCLDQAACARRYTELIERIDAERTAAVDLSDYPW